MKWLLVILGICLMIGLIVLVAGMKQHAGKRNSEGLLKILQRDGNSSLKVIRNGKTVAAIREHDMLPLASVMKTIVAMEYARQCEEGTIDPFGNVSLDELDQYYIPNTDGGGHETWLHYIRENGLLLGQTTTLENVAKGMMAFSSNANTEYLMDLLGMEQINGLLDEMNIGRHETLYPIVSSMLIPTHIKIKNPSFTNEYIETRIKEMPREEYVKITREICEKLKNGEKEIYMKDFLTDETLQKIWSDRLTRSTASEYAEIMGILNGKNDLNIETQKRMDAVMEILMENPGNQSWLEHAGQKGGSTPCVVNITAYATDKEGNATELVFFANNLSEREAAQLSKGMNSFILKVLRDEEFRGKLEGLSL